MKTIPLTLAALAVTLASCAPPEKPEADIRPEIKGDAIVFPASSPALERIAIERVDEPVEQDRVIPGRLAWDEERTVRIYPPFAGRVTRLVARPGDRVAAGAPLAEIMSPDFTQAQSEARKARVDLRLAEQALQRQRELLSGGVAAQKDVQQAEADYARAKAEADRAHARLAGYGQGVESADFVLRSPVAGTVVERNLNPGQELRPDQPGAPLFVVSDPARLWVILDAHESDLRVLKPGMSLLITSNQFPEDSFAGELKQLSDFVDPTSRTVKLRGEVPNPERRLKAEMFVSARLRVPRGDVPTVNAKAVYIQGVRRFVFVRTGGNMFTRRPVKVGPESDGLVPVYSGLQVGEEVAVTGNLFLQQMLSAKAT